jgi:hypothetical protein
MCRILLATLAICLIAAPASAGKFVAVPEVNMGIEPAAKLTADCRISNVNATCGTVFWSLGGWCIDDEVTSYFDLANDPCLAGCTATAGAISIESAEVGLRVVGTACNNNYPITTYPMDVQYFLYTVDPFMSTPDCPFPNIDPICSSTVATVPSLTATAATDPARSYDMLIPFAAAGTPGACNVCELQPLFGGFRFISFSVIESTLAACAQGGASTCAWWYPGVRGRNGDITQAPCAVPCTQYYRNVSVYGPDWYDAASSGLGDLTDMAHWLNVSCAPCPVGVKETTWGKIKSIMNN